MKNLQNLALAALLLATGLTACTEQKANTPENSNVAYVASSTRNPFHRPRCKWAQRISPENLQTFKTREDAIKAGHKPCKVCKP